MGAQSTVIAQQAAIQEVSRSLAADLHTTDSKFDQTLRSFHYELLNQPTNSSGTLVCSPHHLENCNFHPFRSLELDVSHFDGIDPSRWI